MIEAIIKRKHDLPYTLRSLYKFLGLTEQAIAQQRKRRSIYAKRLIELYEKILNYRRAHPGCGLRKMYWQLEPFPFGRDKFINMAEELGFRFEVKRSKARTTVPGELSWENLIEGMLINQIDMVWQSDITYFYSGGKEFYIIFLIDIYSKRIIGYEASEHMKATANLKCLKKAFKKRGRKFFKNLIHHSDRGSQYTSLEYLGKLFSANIVPSMAFNAKENAYVERLNGIIKNEYLSFRNINSLGQLKRWLKQDVEHYNIVRIHESLPEKLSPIKFENKYVNLGTNKRPRMVVYSKGNFNAAKDNTVINRIPEKEIKAFICPI